MNLFQSFYKSWIFFFFFLERYNDTMGQRDWISVQDILARTPVCRLDSSGMTTCRSDPKRHLDHYDEVEGAISNAGIFVET